MRVGMMLSRGNVQVVGVRMVSEAVVRCEMMRDETGWKVFPLPK
jgi:hypothetical protein